MKAKKKITLELDEDKLTNQEKIGLVRYEARKLKYTGEHSSVIVIHFSDRVCYGELNQLLHICYEGTHKN